jgi:hypothetical protein
MRLSVVNGETTEDEAFGRCDISGMRAVKDGNAGSEGVPALVG